MLEKYCPCSCFNLFKNQEVDFIKEYKYWVLYLHFKQHFFGRSLLLLKRHETDISELSKEEIIEQHLIFKKWKNSINRLTHPYNFVLMISNTETDVHNNHLHWHFIPRYNEQFIFEGVNFPCDSEREMKIPYYKVENSKITDLKTRIKIKNALKDRI